MMKPPMKYESPMKQPVDRTRLLDHKPANVGGKNPFLGDSQQEMSYENIVFGVPT